MRAAYKDFEQAATTAKLQRYTGETVKEWFSRMQWGQHEILFGTYEKARYGSFSITDEESREFIKELEKIKSKFFK